jgi:hypothetical protein
MSKPKYVRLTEREFVAEHEKLIPTLRKGSRAAREQEAAEQARELAAQKQKGEK